MYIYIFFDDQDQLVGTFGSKGSNEDQLNYPHGITFQNDHLINDCDCHCMCTFTVEGHFINKFGTQGSGRGQLSIPRCLAVDVSGFILVTDCGNYHIYPSLINMVTMYTNLGQEVLRKDNF